MRSGSTACSRQAVRPITPTMDAAIDAVLAPPLPGRRRGTSASLIGIATPRAGIINQDVLARRRSARLGVAHFAPEPKPKPRRNRAAISVGP
jgi:hypothetical protein